MIYNVSSEPNAAAWNSFILGQIITMATIKGLVILYFVNKLSCQISHKFLDLVV